MSAKAHEIKEPPGHKPIKGGPWKVAVLANIKEHDKQPPPGAPPDYMADYDYIETIQGIQAAIETDGHKTVFIQADGNLPYALQDYKPDICFNIAEGLEGDGREAHAPALLEMLRIPYTASRVLTNAIALDKTLTKRIWNERGLPIASYQEMISADEPLDENLHYPLFIKPPREGTGMGVDPKAVAHNEAELRERVDYVICMYKQPALVEAFLPGREFTVGQMGRPDARKFSRHPEWYDPDGYHRFPILELDSRPSVTPGIYGHAAKAQSVGTNGAPLYLCPAKIEPGLEAWLRETAMRAHHAIYTIDISRVDFRMDSNDQPCLLEINPLPGLTPGYSDICIMSAAEGISYEDLILEILYLAAGRWGLLEHRQND